jgi:hypothetical protein
MIVSVLVKTNSYRTQDSSVTASANLYGKREIVGERHAKERGKKGTVNERRHRQENTQKNMFYTVNTLENTNMLFWLIQ